MYKIKVTVIYPNLGINKDYHIYTEGTLAEVEAALEVIEENRLMDQDGNSGFKPKFLKIKSVEEIEGIIA